MSNEHRVPGLRASELAATPEQRRRDEIVHETLNDFRHTLINNEGFKRSLAAQYLDPHYPTSERGVSLAKGIPFSHNEVFYVADFKSAISVEGKYSMGIDISVDPDITDGLRDRIMLGSTAFHPLEATASYAQDVAVGKEGIIVTSAHPDVKNEEDPFDKTIIRAKEIIVALSTPPKPKT